MQNRRPPHRFLWLALLGWLAQAFVPMAHAAAMAERASAHGGWCNVGAASLRSPALAQKLAELPSEVRRIVLKGSTTVEASTACAQVCAPSASGGIPPTAPALVLPVSPSDAPRVAVVVVDPRPPSLDPPARGPPPDVM